MNPTVPFHFSLSAPAPPPQPWLPILPPDPPPSTAFWDTKKVHDRLADLQHTLILAKAMQKELEGLMKMKDGQNRSVDPLLSGFSTYLEDKNIDFEGQELRSLDAANSLITRLRAQLEPFRSLIDEASPWEEKSAPLRLSQKVLKSKRNKLWRRKKRKCVAEMRAKECEQFDQADREADEWRAREMAKEAALLKMAKMKEIAKIKAKEETKRLESELELVLTVEKLQELRSIRIEKLKKQGHFLPDEDDKFLERVRAAVEEEERQAVAAADTDAAKDAIATFEESRKTIQSLESTSKDSGVNNGETEDTEGNVTENKDNTDSVAVNALCDNKTEGQSYSGTYDSVANLPLEFFHYYHGSNYDMGTLIEVRRTWDTYIRRGGSRIPGHWVQPSPPSNEVWASYLVKRQ